MPTHLWALLSALVATWLAALATFLLKRAAARPEPAPLVPSEGAGRSRGTETRRLLARLLDARVLAAVLLYVLSSGFFLLALLGAQLSVLVPVTTLEYVWIVLLARRYLREEIGPAKLAGIACIILGVILVGLGS